MSFFKKLYIYQKERFPILIYGIYIFCIAFSNTKIILSLYLKTAVFPILNFACNADSILKYGSFILPLSHNLPFFINITIYGSTEAEPISKLDISDMSQEDIYKIENGYGILAGNVCGVYI